MCIGITLMTVKKSTCSLQLGPFYYHLTECSWRTPVADGVSRDSRIAETNRERNILYTTETSFLDFIEYHA